MDPHVQNRKKVITELRNLLRSKNASACVGSVEMFAAGSDRKKYCELIQVELKDVQSYLFKKFDVVQYSDGSDHHYGDSKVLNVNEPYPGKLKSNFNKLLGTLHIHSASKTSVHPTSAQLSRPEKQPNKLLGSSIGWTRQIQKEWKILGKSLPDTIFVRVYENRLDLLRAVIIGPHGTPYQHGLFFFDFVFPSNYPDVPPKVYYHSHGFRLNPNLYENGKVCLSLLGTWSGKDCEKWNPKCSTVLQVLVSLQGLVLNSNPYYNEPMVLRQNDEEALSYMDNAFILSCKTMMCKLRNPPKHFECFVVEHFLKNGEFIISFCESWTAEIKTRTREKSDAAKLEGNEKTTSSLSTSEEKSEHQKVSKENKQKNGTSRVNMKAVKSFFRSIFKMFT